MLFRSVAIECLKRMENEKSPYEKIMAFSKCYEIIQTLISFCKGDKKENKKKEDIGIYIYATIRALPLKLTTNLLYIQIYLTNELSSPYFQNLINLIETIIRRIVMLTYNDLVHSTIIMEEIYSDMRSSKCSKEWGMR